MTPPTIAPMLLGREDVVGTDVDGVEEAPNGDVENVDDWIDAVDVGEFEELLAAEEALVLIGEVDVEVDAGAAAGDEVVDAAADAGVVGSANKCCTAGSGPQAR